MKVRAHGRGTHPRGFAILLLAGVYLGVASFASASGASPSNRTPTTDASPAGDIPDSQAFVAYVSPDSRYSLRVPEGWARTGTGAGVTFTDKLNSIRIDTRPAASAPTVASVRTNDVPGLRTAARGFRLRNVAIVHRKSGSAVVVFYRATSARDVVTGKRIKQDVEVYEFWSAGTLVAITLASPRGSDNVDPWRTVTDSFAWST